MSLPFSISIQKLSGREDRILYNGTPIDSYLTVDEARTIYFELSAQTSKKDQKSCSKFPRKADLIDECIRLVRLYDKTPQEWEHAVNKEKMKLVTKEKNQAKKAAKEAARKALIDECVAVLRTTMTVDDLKIHYEAINILMNERESNTSSSESD